MIELRPYQAKSKQDIRNEFAKGSKRVVLCAPTGSGKTVIFSDMVSSAAKRDTKTLILTDRIELFKQTLKAIERTGTPTKVIHAKSKQISIRATVMLGMIETVKRRWAKAIKQTEGGVLYQWKQNEIDWRYLLDWEPGLIVIDEAHKGNFNKIFTDIFPNSYVIGATATPVGKHFHKYYQSIVQTIDVPDLVEQGYLCAVKAYQMKEVSPDMSDVSMTNRGDFNEMEMFGKFDDAKLYAGLFDEWKRMASGIKTMIFCCNIEHSIKTHEEFQSQGIRNSFIVHSKMGKDERNYNIRSFERSNDGVMINCGILTTGYDHPPIECIVLNRATASLPLFLQMIGRGSRISPETGKQTFTVLDFGENHSRHGCWDERREWSIDKPKKKKKGAAPVRSCEGCEAMLPAMQRICPYCGLEKEITPEEAEELLKQGQMVPVSSVMPEVVGKKISDVSIDELIALEKMKKYKPAYIWRLLRNQGESAIREYYNKKGYKRGWLQRQMRLIEEGDTQVKNLTIR